jgi:hypothetical protein
VTFSLLKLEGRTKLQTVVETVDRVSRLNR